VADRFSVVPAAYVFLRRGDEVLLQLRRGTGYMDEHWAAGAAGHVEAGETVFQAARREVGEELGIVVEIADLRALTVLHRTAGNHNPIDERVDFFFECRAWTGDPHRVEEAKAADLRWFAIGALPDPVVPHERFVLDGVASGRLAPVAAYGFEPGDAYAPYTEDYQS
jgi:8-oxo-dGTP diphosphatase